jgi:WD40 repeat protein
MLMIFNGRQKMIYLKVRFHKIPRSFLCSFLVPRNYNATSDPFRHQLEYTRALNSAKLERMFSKPFIAALDGHNEGVHLLKKHPKRLPVIISGARDGELKVWHLTYAKCLSTLQAHNGPVTGIPLVTISIKLKELRNIC